jgi:putative membrane protein insertion efficiency factor
MLRSYLIFTFVASACFGHALASEPLYSDPYSPISVSIRFYQKYISDLHYGHCWFEPSCSNYAHDAFSKYGVWKGSALAADRLIRCNKGARSFYPKTSNGRLSDPVDVLNTRKQLLVPVWLLPMDLRFPASIDSSKSSGAQRNRIRNGENQPVPITIGDWIAFADYLSQQGDCESTVTAYKFIAFLFGSAEVSLWSKMKSGQCYYNLGQWERAAEQFLEAAHLAEDEAEMADALFMAAASRFNAQSYDQCSSLLLRHKNNRSASYERTSILLSLSFMSEGDWNAGVSELESFHVNNPNSLNAGRALFLLEQAKSADTIPGRNPTLAMILSAVIPGSGHIYSGRVNDGLRHFIFDGLLAYGVYKLIADENYTGAYLLAGVTLPFYAGNIVGAKKSAEYFTRSKRVEAISGWLDDADNH